MTEERKRLMALLGAAHNIACEAKLFEDATYSQQLGEEADYLLDNGVTLQKWIPVTERLPENDGRFICLTKCIGYNHMILSFAKDGEKVDYYDLTGKKDVWYAYDREWGFVATNLVTHWMPLPEPPKEDV